MILFEDISRHDKLNLAPFNHLLSIFLSSPMIFIGPKLLSEHMTTLLVRRCLYHQTNPANYQLIFKTRFTLNTKNRRLQKRHGFSRLIKKGKEKDQDKKIKTAMESGEKKRRRTIILTKPPQPAGRGNHRETPKVTVTRLMDYDSDSHLTMLTCI